jgi:hypothetical protein
VPTNGRAGAAVARLYALPLAEFTAARDRLARELRGAGEKEAAVEVQALRKPVAAAWAANQLALRRGDLLRVFLAALDRLGEVQRGLVAGTKSHDEFREATEAQRAALHEIRAALPVVLREAGGEPREALVSDAARVIRTAAGNEQARALLREGRLIEVPDPAGDEGLAALFASVPAGRSGAQPEHVAGPSAAAAADSKTRAAREAAKAEKARVREAAAKRKAAARWRAAVAKAQGEVEAAERKARAARAAAEEAEAALARARAKADDARAKLGDAQAAS